MTIMNNEPPEFTAEDIRAGKNMWYAVCKHTNVRMGLTRAAPTIFTDCITVCETCRLANQSNELAPYTPMTVAEYNQTFRRFMGLDG